MASSLFKKVKTNLCIWAMASLAARYAMRRPLITSFKRCGGYAHYFEFVQKGKDQPF
jgi:hypothetical protein